MAKAQVPPGAKFMDLPRSELERSLAALSVASKFSTPHAYACLRFPADRLVASAKKLASTDKSLTLEHSLAALLVKIVAASLQVAIATRFLFACFSALVLTSSYLFVTFLRTLSHL